jgi:hypothetical protein
MNGLGYSNLAINKPAAPMTRRPQTGEKLKGSQRVSGGGGVGYGTGTVTTAPKQISADRKDVDEARPISQEEKGRQEIQSKFHPSVLAVVDRLKNKTAATADEARFIHAGKAEIQIWLTDKSDAVMAELKKLGFEVVLDPTTSKMIIGRLPIEKLAALAQMKSVRYVAPQTRK